MPVSRRRIRKPLRHIKVVKQPVRLVLSYVHGHPDPGGPDSIEFSHTFKNEAEARRFAVLWVGSAGPVHLQQKAEMYRGDERLSTFEPMPCVL